jgi:hypothetical protein
MDILKPCETIFKHIKKILGDIIVVYVLYVQCLKIYLIGCPN